MAKPVGTQRPADERCQSTLPRWCIVLGLATPMSSCLRHTNTSRADHWYDQVSHSFPTAAAVSTTTTVAQQNRLSGLHPCINHQRISHHREVSQRQRCSEKGNNMQSEAGRIVCGESWGVVPPSVVCTAASCLEHNHQAAGPHGVRHTASRRYCCCR